MTKMTDSQMKKFFDSLVRDEHDFDDLSISIAMLVALGKFDKYLDIEPDRFETRVSER